LNRGEKERREGEKKFSGQRKGGKDGNQVMGGQDKKHKKNNDWSKEKFYEQGK